jgi:hypothetical protein
VIEKNEGWMQLRQLGYRRNDEDESGTTPTLLMTVTFNLRSRADRPFNLPDKGVHLPKPGKYVVTDDEGIDPLVVVSDKIPEAGDPCEFISKGCLQDPVVTEDVDGFRIGLRQPQALIFDHHLCESKAAVGHEVEVVEQGAMVDGVALETASALLFHGSHQPKVFMIPVSIHNEDSMADDIVIFSQFPDEPTIFDLEDHGRILGQIELGNSPVGIRSPMLRWRCSL